MKLNLLPATVTRGKASRSAAIVMVLLILAGFGLSFFMITSSSKNLADAKGAVLEEQPAAQKAYDTSQMADTLMQKPEVQDLVRNIALSEDMIKHNDDYPDLYNSLKPYFPPFFRITSLAAAPIDDKNATVTVSGTLTSYQQYADLMLALMRNKKARSVSRSGFQSEDAFVPNLTQVDQVGAPRKPNEGLPPEDPLQRLAFFSNQPDPYAYTGAGNFGSALPVTKGAMPGESLVTVVLTVEASIETPSPRATLGASGGSGAVTASTGVGGAPPGFGPPPGAAPGMTAPGAGGMKGAATGAN